MTDLTHIVEAVFALASALITAFLIPWIKARVDAEKLQKIKSWVGVAVEAAEQVYSEEGAGKDKKAYVLKFLNEKGFTLDLDSIDKLIEAAVLELNSKK